MNKAILASTVAMLVSSCGTYFPDSMSTSKDMRFIEPTQNWRKPTGECQAGATCWSELDDSRIRSRLSSLEAGSHLFRRDEDGGFSYLGANAKVGRGQYRLEKYITAYTTIPCQTDTPSAGLERVGVGVRVVADITSYSRNVDLGDLFPMAFSAQQDEIRGNMKIRSWGITSNNATLKSLIKTSSVSLDDEGVQSALNALTIGEAMLDDPDTRLSPWSFAVVEDSVGSCDS